MLPFLLAIYGSTGTQKLDNHLPGRFDQTILSTEPIFPEDSLVNSIDSG